MTIETYHEVKIHRTADVLGFPVRASEAFCISVRERADDGAPIIDMFATIEEAREAIDEHFAEQSLSTAESGK